VNSKRGKSTEDCRITQPKKRAYAFLTYHRFLSTSHGDSTAQVL
jgi:hypothetical protein